jgi:predicted RNase H-like nuclease (RuvC/YqgF family)
MGSPTSTAVVGQPTTKSSKDSVRDTELVESNPPKKVYPGNPRSIEERFEREREAWRYYGQAQTRILNQIGKEKYQRRHELLLIDRRKSKLEEWRKRLEQMQYDLTTREDRILESEPYLSLAKKLQEMKLSLEDALPWIETINEVAQMQNMDIKSAAIFVAQELRLNRQMGGIERQIEIAQGQLKMLDTICAQKEKALSILADFQNKGVSSDERMGRDGLGPDNGQKIGINMDQNIGQNPTMGQYLLDSFSSRHPG